MIIREDKKIKDYDFVRTYSDLSVYIRKIKTEGREELYAEAWDPLEFKEERQYEETNIPLSVFLEI